MSIDHTNSIEITPWKKSLLVLFPAMWMLFHLAIVSKGIVMPETIAEALGGSIVILVIPSIITGSIYVVQRIRGVHYQGYVKHTVIGSGAFFFLAIASVFNN